MTRLRPLSESECYTRLYGERESTVSVIRETETESERPSGGLLGEQLVRLFEEQQLDDGPGRLPEVEAA
ncbi:MAG TPA: hypothetical protein VN449_02320 [Gaiellaceae bacterium]|nr:hypothetical protein [Gaiellaceae bacterium]